MVIPNVRIIVYSCLTGNCTVNSAVVPTCVDCHLSMGVACQLNCIHGHESPPNSQKCVCEACYGGDDCNVECSQRGSCGNGSCTCDAGYRGESCQLLDCPGQNQLQQAYLYIL